MPYGNFVSGPGKIVGITLPAAYAPPSKSAFTCSAVILPSFVTPVFTVIFEACRTVVERMSSRYLRTNFTGRPVAAAK